MGLETLKFCYSERRSAKLKKFRHLAEQLRLFFLFCNVADLGAFFNVA